MKYHPTEQIELIIIGAKTVVILRDKLEAISHAAGRPYNHVTRSSLQRIVNLMNSSMDLEVKYESGFVSIVGWRRESFYSDLEEVETRLNQIGG